MTYRMTPERKAEWIAERQAERRIWIHVRNRAETEIRQIDEAIAVFGESENGATR